MKLLIRRDQRNGLLGGKPIFTMDVRASLSEEEKSNIKKYKLADVRLYEKRELHGPGIMGSMGLLGVARLAGHLAAKAMNITLDVKDLENGKKIECKDIVEMLAVEEQVREAATMFKAILDAAAHFGGEEAIEL